ncbi:MAG: DUF819 family protein [Alistipes sp.]|nr:DUF819 family protein [Alistipes sp.]MBQ3212347.1 DUF819 family protein [Alistipes sp.]
MTVWEYIVYTVFLCVAPAGVIWACRRFPLLGRLGPIMVLYAVGMVVGNMPFLPAGIATLQEIIPNVMIPLAIPMMLFGCSFSRGEARLQMKIIFSGFLSVCVAVTIGYLFFGRYIGEGAEVGGIITGMYTGGTLNAAALQAIFRIDSERFVLINSYDIIISFLYFVFLFSVGIKMFRRLYGERDKVLSDKSRAEIEEQIVQTEQNPYRRLWSREGAQQLGRMLLYTLMIVAVSAGVALLMPDGWFMVVFILLLTTLGVACSCARFEL